MSLSGVYAIKNLVNGKCYVGSAISINQRWFSHQSLLRRGKHHSVKLQRAYEKYGKENFEYVILELVKDIIALTAREQYWMEKLIATHPRKGYNVQPFAASALGIKRSEKTKQKMRDRKYSMKTRRLMSKNMKGRKSWNTGMKMPMEFRVKISQAKIGKPGTRLGKRTTLKTKKLLSANNRLFSNDTLLKIRRMHKNGMSVTNISKIMGMARTTTGDAVYKRRNYSRIDKRKKII